MLLAQTLVMSPSGRAPSLALPPEDAAAGGLFSTVPAPCRLSVSPIALRVDATMTRADNPYRTLFEQTNDAVAILTAHGVMIEVNQRWEQLLGIPRSSIVGHRVTEFAPGGDASGFATRFRRSIEGPHREDLRVPIERPDGKLIHVDFSTTVIEMQGESRVFAIGRDVTDAVEAAAACATAEEKYRLLLENVPDVVWVCDASGLLTFITPNCEALFGLDASSVRAGGARTWLERVHHDDVAGVVQAFHGMIDEGSLFSIEYRWRRPDGTWIWLWHRATTRHDDRGDHFFDGTIADVTEKKSLEESLRVAQKMEAIGQLTGAIAHDFNNVLAVILANAHLIVEALPPGQASADAKEIGLVAERAASLTRQLLSFSRRQALAPRVVELGEVVTGMEKMLLRVLGEDLELVVLRPNQQSKVRVDVGQIEQVVMNLAVNARDSMPLGGTLTLGVHPIEVEQHARPGCPPGSYVALEVTDTGCGMTIETRKRIFEPFFTTKGEKGSGLGLSTSFGIIKQSGGQIEVESEVGRGTTMRVLLPRVEDAIHVRPSSSGLCERGEETVLLVEDDPSVRNSVAKVLESLGYHVLPARDGRDARAITRAHIGPIHLVLTDMVMPGLWGPDVVAAIKRMRPSIKVIYMSGYADRALFERSGCGNDVTLVDKPFSAELIARTLRETLRTAS